MIKQVNRYEIRYYTETNLYSYYVGFKARLLPYKKAVKIINRLKKSGIDAFHAKMIINIEV